FSTQNAKVSELENDKAGLADQVQQAASAYGIAKAVFEQGLLAIPEEVRVLSVLKEKIAEAEAEKGNLERLWEKIQQELQRTKEQYTEASVGAKHAAATAKEIEQKKDNAQQQWNEALQKSEFASEQAYQLAKLTERERTALKEAIQVFKQNRHTLTEQIKELQE